MDLFLQELHSILRWVVLILLVAAIFNGLKRWRTRSVYSSRDRLLNLLSMISVHTQVLIGLILYVIGPRMSAIWKAPGDMIGERLGRFFLVEHITAMLLAAILLTIGRKRAENSTGDRAKHRKIFIWYLIAFVIILASIPWPFRFSDSGFEYF